MAANGLPGLQAVAASAVCTLIVVDFCRRNAGTSQLAVSLRSSVHVSSVFQGRISGKAARWISGLIIIRRFCDVATGFPKLRSRSLPDNRYAGRGQLKDVSGRSGWL